MNIMLVTVGKLEEKYLKQGMRNMKSAGDDEEKVRNESVFLHRFIRVFL